MSKILKTASAVAVALTTAAAFIGTDVTLAFDNAQAASLGAGVTVSGPIGADVAETTIELQDETLPAAGPETATDYDNSLTVQPLPETSDDDESATNDNDDPLTADSLRQLVTEYSVPGSLSDEMQCLAGAVYFESKGESLKGQLAVARVIIARSESGRFPDSYCGVVYQRSQFSFVRGGHMPSIRTASRAWKNAVKIARIAHDSAWSSPVEGALFFHASRVSPKWRLKKIAQVDNHIFYR